MRTPRVGASRTDTAMTKRTGDFAGKGVLSRASERAAAGEPFVPSTVVEARGFASASVSSKTTFDVEDAVLRGWVRRGPAGSTIALATIEILETEGPQIVDVGPDKMAAGGNVNAGRRMDLRPFPHEPASGG
jgi:hypothetical protein